MAHCYLSISQQIRVPFRESYIACRIKLKTSEAVICAFYNLTTVREYRYSMEDFQQLLKNIPESEPAIICGDMNFPKTNWKTNSSPAKEENSIFKKFEEALFRQARDFLTCSQKILDVTFNRNCFVCSD